MTNPEPGCPGRAGRRDWMLGGVDGATVMLLGTLWAVTGIFWWVLLASAWGALTILQRHPATPPH